MCSHTRIPTLIRTIAHLPVIAAIFGTNERTLFNVPFNIFEECNEHKLITTRSYVVANLIFEYESKRKESTIKFIFFSLSPVS